jgi:hypothetical protein
MKHFFVLVISGLLNIAGFTQPIDPANYSSPVKVACIGNSITFGFGIADRPRDSYPAQLGRMLGDQWIVRNFGVGGRTMLKEGDSPFWTAYLLPIYEIVSGLLLERICSGGR